MSAGYKDAIQTKREILVERGIIKKDQADNIRYQADLPRGFSLNLCGHCTYKCSYCPQGTKYHPKEFIKVEVVEKVFNELGNRAVYVQMGTRGENLLHPNFFDFVRLIKSKNKMSFVCLNTNGFIIDDKMMEKLFEVKIDQIIFSLQTMNSEIYKKITGSKHHRKVVGRIIEFAKTKNQLNSKLLLTVQFLDFFENKPFKQEFIETFKPFNINIHNQILHSWGDHFPSLSNNDPDRYPCPYLFLYPTISHLGNLAACFIDFYDEMSYGSLMDETISQLWQGKKAKEIREKHLLAKWGEIPMCRNCDGYKSLSNGFKFHDGQFILS